MACMRCCISFCCCARPCASCDLSKSIGFASPVFGSRWLAASAVFCCSCCIALDSAAMRAAAESAAARAELRCSSVAGTFSVSSRLTPSARLGDASRAMSCKCIASPAFRLNLARSRTNTPVQSARPAPPSCWAAAGSTAPLASTRQILIDTFSRAWSSLASNSTSTLSFGSTRESTAGERISATGAESGMTSMESDGGTSAICVVWPRAVHSQLAVSVGWKRPLNRRPSGFNRIVSRPCESETMASGSEAWPEISTEVPAGSRSGASPGSVSGARLRYDG